MAPKLILGENCEIFVCHHLCVQIVLDCAHTTTGLYTAHAHLQLVPVDDVFQADFVQDAHTLLTHRLRAVSVGCVIAAKLTAYAFVLRCLSVWRQAWRQYRDGIAKSETLSSGT